MEKRKKPNRTKSRMEIYIPEDDKIRIKEKSKALGYSSVSSFLLDSSKSFFRLKVDMSVYRDLIREINYIGKNINSIVRRINSEKFFSDTRIGKMLYWSKCSAKYKNRCLIIIDLPMPPVP